MYCIKRPIEGISLNRDEYLLDDEDEVVLFETEKLATNFCNENNLDLEWISTYEKNIEGE